MKRRPILFLLVCLVVCAAQPGLVSVRAENNSTLADRFALDQNIKMTLGLQTGYIKGDSTYRINFPGGASELKFPLDSSLYGIYVEVNSKASNTDRLDNFRFTLRMLSTMGSNSGKMKDSDWIEDDVGYINWWYDYDDDGLTNGSAAPPFVLWNNPGKDIYSESDTKLDANITDFNYIYNFSRAKNVAFGTMIGYRYQKFVYDIRNLQQVGYGPYGPGYFDQTCSESGQVLKYRVEYSFLYLGLSTDILLGDRLRLNLKAGFSDMVNAADVDDHVLRYKISRGDASGSAWLVNLSVDWQLSERLSVQVSGENVDIDTTGAQEQYFYAGSDAGSGYTGIRDKITSSSFIGSLGIQYRF